MTEFSTRDVATLLGLPARQIRWFARSGVLSPDRDPRSHRYRFTFRDLVLLRTAAGLLAARIPPRRIVRVLRRLRQQLPDDRALTELRIQADGEEIVAHDDGGRWNAESGQFLLDFAVADLAAEIASLGQRRRRDTSGDDAGASASTWFQLGTDLEATSSPEAREAYRRALALDPDHADANVNLGRLLHEAGRPEEAALHYRRALEAGAHGTAWYNLGVALEDLHRPREALAAYESAIEAAPELADAFYNLSNLSERLGDRRAALRHLRRYRELADRGSGTLR